MGNTPRSVKDNIRDIDGSMASASLQLSPDGGTLNNDILWRKQMGKEADLMFTVTIGMPFWGLGEHEPLIIDFLFLLYLAGVGGYLIQSKGVIGNLEQPEMLTCG